MFSSVCVTSRWVIANLSAQECLVFACSKGNASLACLDESMTSTNATVFLLRTDTCYLTAKIYSSSSVALHIPVLILRPFQLCYNFALGLITTSLERSAITSSASRSIVSSNSLQVGTSFMRPTHIPHVQIPASTSPFSKTWKTNN